MVCFGYLKIALDQVSQVELQCQNLIRAETSGEKMIREETLFNNIRRSFYKLGVLKINKCTVTTIGRDPGLSGLVINSPYVSTKHCSIWGVQFEDGSLPMIYLKDTSLNGVYINGKKTCKNQVVLLNHNDVVEMKCAFHAVFKYTTKYKTLHLQNSALFENKIVDQSIEQVSSTWLISERVLGEGTFGSVHVGKHCSIKCSTGENVPSKSSETNTSKTLCAVKIIKTINYNVQVKEAEILEKLDHVYETVATQGRLYIYEELVCGGDLFSYLSRSSYLSPIPEPEAMMMFYQVLLAIDYLHQHGIVHRDLKLDNILLESPEPLTRVVLADFGTACNVAINDHFLATSNGIKKRMNTLVGTAEYSAPEIGFVRQLDRQHQQEDDYKLDFEGERILDTYEGIGRNEALEFPEYTKKCDFWSIGVILHMLLTGISPFLRDDDKSTIKAVVQGKLDFEKEQWKNVSAQAQDIVAKLLQTNVQKRFDVEQCMNHVWISDYVPVLQDVYKKKIIH